MRSCSTLSVHEVAGTAEVAGDETESRFTPEQLSAGCEYQETVATALEDLAGNRVGRAFDVDVFDSVTRSCLTNGLGAIPSQAVMVCRAGVVRKMGKHRITFLQPSDRV
jgi:hypothetical protein